MDGLLEFIVNDGGVIALLIVIVIILSGIVWGQFQETKTENKELKRKLDLKDQTIQSQARTNETMGEVLKEVVSSEKNKKLSSGSSNDEKS